MAKGSLLETITNNAIELSQALIEKPGAPSRDKETAKRQTELIVSAQEIARKSLLGENLSAVEENKLAAFLATFLY